MRTRLALVLVALVLSVSSLALAQGFQRWQYATLSVTYEAGISGFTYGDPNGYIFSDSIADFIPRLREHVGVPDLFVSPNPIFMIEILNILGWRGWEMVANTDFPLNPMDASPWKRQYEYTFRRPSPN